MSHHFVTVCVVCVLCAAHTPCSAHTEFSTAGQTVPGSVKPKNPLGPNEQLQPSWLVTRLKGVQQRDARKTNSNNLSIYKNGAARLSNLLDINNGNRRNLVPVAAEEARIKSQENVRTNGHVRAPATKEDSAALKDLEILERLGQIEILRGGELNSVRSFRDQSPVDRIRAKRNMDVIDEKYFMKKIFEAYGDGASVTMEGFEKLLRKLGLLRLLTDISSPDDRNIVTSQHENLLGEFLCNP